MSILERLEFETAVDIYRFEAGLLNPRKISELSNCVLTLSNPVEACAFLRSGIQAVMLFPAGVKNPGYGGIAVSTEREVLDFFASTLPDIPEGVAP